MIPKGYKFSQEARDNMGKSHVGYKFSIEAKKKMSIARIKNPSGGTFQKGNKYRVGISPSNIEQLRHVNAGNKYRVGKPAWNKGLKMSLEYRKKLSDARLRIREMISGSNHPMWKGGVTSENHKIRESFEMSLWRKSVFERDGYVCIWGGKEHGNKLHADHIKPFSLFPELRLAIDNGRTLCQSCHHKITSQQHRDGIFSKAVATRFKKN